VLAATFIAALLVVAVALAVAPVIIGDAWT